MNPVLRLRILARTLVLLLVVTLVACAGSQQDLDSYIAGVKERPGEPIEPLPRVVPPVPFSYSVADLRDPFSGGPAQPSEDIDVSTAQDDGPRPDPTRRKEVLEGFELDSLEMVGTFYIEELYGLVSDPDGLIHRVRPGNFLGRNHGRIVTVFEDRIELQELVPNGTGGWMYRDAKVALDDS